MQFRVTLLNGLAVYDSAGTQLPLPPPKERRLLVAFALRPDMRRHVNELSAVVWPDYHPDLRPKLEVVCCRLRKQYGVPIGRREGDTYRSGYLRNEVDATWFVDAMTSESITTPMLRELLGLWQEDPQRLFPYLHDDLWRPLVTARRRLIARLASLSASERSQLGNLDHFCELFPAETQVLTSRELERSPSVLIVDDDTRLTDRLSGLLSDYRCEIVHTAEDAIRIITNSSISLGCALVDLNLTHDREESGYGILSTLQTRRPEVPRALLTANPPDGGMAELINRYKLFEVLVKNGPDAPALTRATVDAMMGTAKVHVHKKNLLAFESHVAAFDQHQQRAIIAARKQQRLDAANRAYDHSLAALADQLAEYKDEVDSIRTRLHDVDTDHSGVVASFHKKWASRFASDAPPCGPVPMASGE